MPTPQFGEDVFHAFDEDAFIEISSVSIHQPLASDGIYLVTDQYGEQHLVELENGQDNDRWNTVLPDSLTNEQSNLLHPEKRHPA